MVGKLELLDAEAHRRLRLRTEVGPYPPFVMITLNEFPAAAAVCPIFFAKDNATGEFYAGAMFGFQAGELLIEGADRGKAPFQPLELQRQGFFISDENIAIDADHSRFGEGASINLFEEDGQPSEAMRGIQRALGQLKAGVDATRMFIREMLDLKLIGADHLYKKDKGFDPEGLLGTLPAIVNVLAGYLVGQAVQATNDKLRLVRQLILLGGALIIAGLAWSPFFPIAKKLWSGSYVLLTIGIDMMLLGGLIALIDVRRLRLGQGFWLVLGRNPLAIYLFSELFVTTLNLFPVRGYESAYALVGIALFQRIAPGAVGSLLCAIAYTMVCWTVGWLLDRKGIIVKV